MLFNSSSFVIFFAVVYALYLATRRWGRTRNAMLLVASYVFYGWWDWRFLSLLAFSTGVDYVVSHAIERSSDPRRRKRLLWVSVVSNLGLLGVFKYFDFFSQSFAALGAALGLHLTPFTLQVTLPVGISFYTFQTLGYTIDVYRRRVSAAPRLLDFALYVAFFPQLVAGPIERASHLLPQIAARTRSVSGRQIEQGVFLVLWGFTKKMVIADRAGLLADQIFNHHQAYSGLDLVAGVLAFTFQIYGDFSGYTDIARGISKLLGFELTLNFRLPYFATSPADFWRRWHISLSQWLRDYLYIPLGGNRGGRGQTMRNLMITMLLGGLWHGARWNFVIWGGFHGALLIAYRLLGIDRSAPRSRFGYASRVACMFLLTMLGWVIFRAETLEQLGYFLSGMWQLNWTRAVQMTLLKNAVLWAPLVTMQLFQHRTQDLLCVLRLQPGVRGLLYGMLAVAIITLGVRERAEFIYFQF